MKRFPIVISAMAIMAVLVPASARAQQAEFKDFTAGVGSILRFRQFGDAATLGKGRVELGVQLTSADDAEPAWNGLALDQSSELPGVVARVGVGNRVDVGAWGRLNTESDYAAAGIDTKIMLMKQGPASPVSIAIRPSISALIGPSEVWAGNASIDFSVSRAIGNLSPYVGVATTGSLVAERSKDLDLDPATANGSTSYAGLTYRWKTLVVAAEVERADVVSYGIRVGTRF